MTAFREFMDRDCTDEGKELESGEPVTIELQDVSFRFSEDGPYVLRHINLTLHEGEKIALVGENGAGKSTLVKIMCGLYRPSEGKVLVNGIDLEELKLSGYQQLLAAAFQDTYILPMSIGENVAFGAADSHREEIRKCLETAGLDGRISGGKQTAYQNAGCRRPCAVRRPETEIGSCKGSVQASV